MADKNCDIRNGQAERSRSLFLFFVEITNLVPKVESMTKLRPGLSGNPDLLVIKFNLTENVMQKRLGAEDGLRRPNKYCLGKSFCI